LTPQEVDAFFETLKEMRDDGKSIILITHKLEEITSIADEVTVLRDGKMIGRRAVDCTVTKDDLTRMMVGRDVLFDFPKNTIEPGEVKYSIKNVCAKNDKGLPALKEFSLDIRENEVIGLAGVDGNGQKELCEVLTGLRKSDSGEIILNNKKMVNKEPVYYIEQGVSHIPEDRHTTGLALNWSLKRNLILKELNKAPFVKNGLLQPKVIDKYWYETKAEYQIKSINGEEKARALSGGNQQKIILAREINLNPQVLIANQPTRGLDVSAAEYVRKKVLDARNAGTSVLLISADLEEILQLSDRIAVIFDGKLMGILPRGASTHEIGALMMGKKQEVASCEN